MPKAILPIVMILLSLSAQAGPQSDALSSCLADNTTGKERKELARWVFIAMSVHPEIRALAAVSEQERTESNQSMGGLVTRLLAENCAAQAKSTLQAEGGEGVQSSFRILGQLAMQEIMSNQEVAAAIGEYAKYLDQKRLDSALGGK